MSGQGDVDVRQQLASDRTLLAWTRTAIALAGLGFVVARFDLYLHEIGRRAGSGESARVLGLALVASSAVVVVIGLAQHRRVAELLTSRGDPPASPQWPAISGAIVALFAIVALGVYLATRLA
jgi:putative membrane protein